MVMGFIGGILCLGAAGVLGLRDNMNRETQNKEFRSHNYNLYLQSEYDRKKDGLTYNNFEREKVKEEILEVYPNMSLMWVTKVGTAAMMKRLFEEETGYEYHIPEDIREVNIDVSMFATDKTRKHVNL